MGMNIRLSIIIFSHTAINSLNTQNRCCVYYGAPSCERIFYATLLIFRTDLGNVEGDDLCGQNEFPDSDILNVTNFMIMLFWLCVHINVILNVVRSVFNHIVIQLVSFRQNVYWQEILPTKWSNYSQNVYCVYVCVNLVCATGTHVLIRVLGKMTPYFS